MKTFLTSSQVEPYFNEIFWMYIYTNEKKLSKSVFLLEKEKENITITPIYWNIPALLIKAVFVKAVILPILWLISRMNYYSVNKSTNDFLRVYKNGLENSIDIIHETCQKYDVTPNMEFYTKANSYFKNTK